MSTNPHSLEWWAGYRRGRVDLLASLLEALRHGMSIGEWTDGEPRARSRRPASRLHGHGCDRPPDDGLLIDVEPSARHGCRYRPFARA